MPARPDYLTPRQREILEFIVAYLEARGVAPTLREIRDHLGVSSYATVHKHLSLLTEKGYLARDEHQKRGMEVLRRPSGSEAADAPSGFPFLGRIAAGQPIEAVEQDERLEVPDHLLGGPRDEHYVLEVVGDSMIEEGIHDGDWVVVRRREVARSGEMVVALVGEEATLKRYFPEGDRVRLQPANHTMAPIHVAASELRVRGVVVGLMRRF